MSRIFKVGSSEEELFGCADILRELERRIDKDLDSLSNQVLSGQVDSYDGYKYKVGIIHGLGLGKKHLKELRSL